mgnify:CR=1 FL=1
MDLCSNRLKHLNFSKWTQVDHDMRRYSRGEVFDWYDLSWTLIVIRRKHKSKRHFVVWVMHTPSIVWIHPFDNFRHANITAHQNVFFAHAGIHPSENGAPEFLFQRYSRKCAIVILALRRRGVFLKNSDKRLVEHLARFVFHLGDLQNLIK